MNKLVPQLLMYRSTDNYSSVLNGMAAICSEAYLHGESLSSEQKEALVSRLYGEVKELLKIATDYGFDKNLWQDYLTFLLIMNENPFSLVSEKQGALEGSVNTFVKHDFDIFIKLFHYDFSRLEGLLGTDLFGNITHYHSVTKKELMYNKGVSEKVRALSDELCVCMDADSFYVRVTDFYRMYGVGMFGINKAFRFKGTGDSLEFIPINNMDQVMLSDLVGYELQKKKLVDNTKAFACGLPANNVLLYGDSGTGKSTCIKAIVNQFYPDGLRMIEIYKHQFKDLSNIIARLKNRNYRFIIYMDDLSFEENETEYKFLKAVIEGGVETRPDNILIYATSNRRHLIRENFSDRNDMEFKNDIHRSDTLEEKLSLVSRFGINIFFEKPEREQYRRIAVELTRRAGVTPEMMDDETIMLEADRFELRSGGGASGRTAQQLANHLQAVTGTRKAGIGK